MIMLFLDKKAENIDTRAKVDVIHFMPDILSDEEKKDGILIDEIPKAEEIKGKSAHLLVNTETLEMWYEYEDVSKTREQIWETKLELMQQALDELLLGGM
jgi:hypothetical protein